MLEGFCFCFMAASDYLTYRISDAAKSRRRALHSMNVCSQQWTIAAVDRKHDTVENMKPVLADVLRAVAVSLVALAISFSILRPAGELSAILIRRRWPDAWFSGLIVWYAVFFAAGLSIVIALVVGRYTLVKTKRLEHR